ncbi:MAG: non-homologous end-joining DNA ligase [Gordonia sp. (in: high G+C Gram-positive bacteria)]|uniref:non-homologous end-joining DNA ligase n=1 Tax=Gordonia sp. (in: high G+C Gram-positive bacteria) TaxID=84139 RepID=UPI0039E4770D
MAGSELEVDGHLITVTNLDRVLYPETGTRKYDVIAYYLAVADAMLPHMTLRPVTRKRWPSGVPRADGAGAAAPFFEKNLPVSAPDWIARFTIAHSNEGKTYPVACSAADLVWFAQMAALELHVPQWRTDLVEEQIPRTDRLVLDLDPGPGVPLSQVAQVASTIREVLADAGMTAYPVTSGGSGMHVYANLPSVVRTDSARTLAKEIATGLQQAHPDDITASMAKDAREGRVFIDWSQNSAAKTTLAPYSMRGRERPWAAAPRTWAELDDPGLRQLLYSEVIERLTADGDLLAGLDGSPPPPAAPTDRADPPARPPSHGDHGVVDLGEYRSRHASPPAGITADRSDSGGIVVPLRPMLAVDEGIAGLTDDDWAFEGKWDGYRVLARILDGRIRLQSRSGIDMTADFPELDVLTDALAGHDVILDGEVVALDDAGRTDFTLLASRRKRPGEFTLKLLLFDVLHLDGRDLESLPWEQRRAMLDGLAPLLAGSPAEIPPLIDGPGAAAADHARSNGWEGVVAKRRSSPYRQGRRSADWRKAKNWNDVSVVIGGYRLGRGESNARTLGSLLVGLPEETGLRYVGRVGTGFTQAQAADLLAELRPLEISICPFVDTLDRPVASSATWVLPKLVADVRFMDWTSTGHLRHPSWRGVRRDLLPGDL